MLFETLTAIWSHVNENEKKKNKNKKNNNNNKKCFEIWWTGRFFKNLVLIRLMVSEKMAFMDGQTDDGRPRDSSSQTSPVC